MTPDQGSFSSLVLLFSPLSSRPARAAASAAPRAAPRQRDIAVLLVPDPGPDGTCGNAAATGSAGR
jgi:hypothetical protein